MAYLDYLKHGTKLFRKRGQLPVYLVYFITDACNAKCKHCLLADGAHPGWEEPSMLYRKQELARFTNLIVAIHALEWLCPEEKKDDKAQKRNLRLYAHLTDEPAAVFDYRLGGRMKPRGFIHPFEGYYSLPGDLDATVVSAIGATVDELARDLAGQPDPNRQTAFLAFAYMGFLLVHPFVDGNGRTSRGMLDYYHARLKFSCSTHGRAEHSVKFAKEHEHIAAFTSFFKDAGLPRCWGGKEPYPVLAAERPVLQRMATELQNWAAEFCRGQSLRPCHEAMARLLPDGPARISGGALPSRRGQHRSAPRHSPRRRLS